MASEKKLSERMAIWQKQHGWPALWIDEVATLESELAAAKLDAALLGEERLVHEEIGSICFAAGASTADGTSVSAVKSLAEALAAKEREIENLRAALAASAPQEETPSPKTIEDGFGSTWSAVCSQCGCESMYVNRPGDARCSHCEANEPS